MSNGRRKDEGPRLVPTGIAELHQKTPGGRFLRTMSGMPLLSPESVTGFRVEAGEHVGFKFLTTFGPRAVRAFKLLAVARSKTRTEIEGRLAPGELELLVHLLGADFVALALQAYEACQELTHDQATLSQVDERTAWRLTEFWHLFANIMKWGEQRGTLSESQTGRVLTLLVRELGAYYGLLADDTRQTRQESLAVMVEYLRAFRKTPRYKRELPVDKMTRLPLLAPLSVNLLDYEIARGLEPHSIAVKERTVRGDDQGNLAAENAVEFTSHNLQVFYTRDLTDEGRAIVNAILPVFAISAFDGFGSMADVEEHLGRRRQVIRQTEQESFALLQCLHHYGGRVPPSMKEFRAADVMKAAQRVYREREREREERRPKAQTAGKMLVEGLRDTLQNLKKPVSFEWPGDRTVFKLVGYPEHVVFFPQNVTVKNPEGEDETFTFLCHARADRDPNFETPLMFEYQAVLSETQLFDAHAALRDLFANAPDTFRRTLDAGPVVLYAKQTLFADDPSGGDDSDEVRLLGMYVALNGGMKSWVGQHYLLSRTQGNVFIRFPDVREYLSRVLPGQ